MPLRINNEKYHPHWPVIVLISVAAVKLFILYGCYFFRMRMIIFK